MASIKIPAPQGGTPTRSKNRMLTGYVFNITYTFPALDVKPQLDQKIVYAKSLEIAEDYINKMYTNQENLEIVYEGFFFQ